jgi:hypothetical protein
MTACPICGQQIADAARLDNPTCAAQSTPVHVCPNTAAAYYPSVVLYPYPQ